MKEVELKKVRRGEVFIAFGEEFVALDHFVDGVFCLRKGNWKNALFDAGNKNNLEKASIMEELRKYQNSLIEKGANPEDFHRFCIDLKETDGSAGYGSIGVEVGLLTLEQYGKYKDLIPTVSETWWLATPLWTPWICSLGIGTIDGVWYVNSDGDYNCSFASNSRRVRPVLRLSSSLFVTINEEDSKTIEDYTELELLAELQRRIEK